MNKRNAFDTNKISKRNNYRKYAVKICGSALQSHVAQDVKARNNTLNYHFDEVYYNKGMEWFNSGLPLEDASDEMKKNVCFIKGFEKSKRIKIINEQLYDLGREYFERGTLLEDIPEKYRDKEFFMSGYNEAMSKCKHR